MIGEIKTAIRFRSAEILRMGVFIKKMKKWMELYCLGRYVILEKSCVGREP